MKYALTLFFFLFVSFQAVLAQNQPLVPAVDHPVYFDISPPLRDLLKTPIPQADGSWKDGVVKNYIDTNIRETSGKTIIQGDEVLQNYFGSLLSDTTIQNFNGLNNIGGYVPPDTHGDVGFNHYFEVVNCSYAIYNKSGAKIFGPAGNSTIWMGLPNNSNDGDAVVLFDELANRWLFSQFSLPNGSSTAPFFQMIAVSQTPDPTGAWYRYVYEFSAMPDYPKFGIWPDGYYMTTNNFGTGGAGYVGNGAYSYDRNAMLAGNPDAQRISFNVPPGSEGFITLLPADCDGAFPPLGTPNYLTYIRTGGTQRLGIYEFHSDWANPANSTFGNLTYLNVTPFTSLGWSNGIPQLGSPQVLETLGDRLMYRLQYRKFNGYASMVLNHSVTASAGVAGIRWYELRNTGSAWTIYQQATYAPDNHSRWMGSIAQDTAGTISLGYSVSSSTMYPAIRYTGRLKNDPLNQMTIMERTIINGGGSQTGNWSGRSRWGDYSAMSIDPSAPTTFWFTTEYYPSTSTSSWQTRIASFTFANVFSSAASATPAILCGTSPDTCQLFAYGYGGSGNYTYSWTSIPPGFTSTLQNPKVKPLLTTKYVVATSDGTLTRHDTTEMRIVPPPTATIGNDTIICWYVAPIQLHANATNYQRFLWGSTGDGTFTDPSSLNTAYIPGIKDKTSGGTDIKLICWPNAPCLNKASDLMHITLDPCTGMDEIKNNQPFLTISPNPARDKMTVTMANLTGAAQLAVTAMDGRICYRTEVTPENQSATILEIDIHSFSKGIYIVSLRNGEYRAQTRLVVE